MINSKSIDDLFPTLKRAAIELTKRMKDKGYDMGISSTYRDSESQGVLYAQGRTKPGLVVTNAKAGQSYHNYHLAFDIFQNKKGAEYNLNFLKLAGSTAMSMGLEWGGSWAGFVDLPHIQWSDGLTLTQLANGVKPVDKKLLWETVIVVPDSPVESDVEIKPEIKTLIIDNKSYMVNSILYENKNYIQLRDFEQAGYKIGYSASDKVPSINKP